MQKPSVEQLRKSIDQARKVHDEPTVKALSDMLYEATGVYEPEFAPVESSGDPKLDSLRRALVQAVAARDEPTEATLRGMIKDIEGEMLPEVNVELTEEVDVEVVEEEAIENPFLPQDYIDKFKPEEIENPFDIPEEVEVDELDAELADVAEYYEAPEPLDIGIFLKDDLMATQIAALRKAGFTTEAELRNGVCTDKAPREMLGNIRGISDKSVVAIMGAIGYGYEA